MGLEKISLKQNLSQILKPNPKFVFFSLLFAIFCTLIWFVYRKWTRKNLISNEIAVIKKSDKGDKKLNLKIKQDLKTKFILFSKQLTELNEVLTTMLYSEDNSEVLKHFSTAKKKNKKVSETLNNIKNLSNQINRENGQIIDFFKVADSAISNIKVLDNSVNIKEIKSDSKKALIGFNKILGILTTFETKWDEKTF